MLNVRTLIGSLDKNTLETEITQLKDNITSLRIQNDGYKIDIENQTQRYLELSKASTHPRNTSNEKIAALNAEIGKIKPSGSGTNVSGPKTPEQPKVLALGMYAISSRYITPPKRGDWAPPTPRKKQVTFQETPRVSTTHTKQTDVNNQKKPNENKPHVARPKTIPNNVRKTDITVTYRIVPQWKPTGRQFILCDIYGPKTSKAPISKPLELSSSGCSRHMTGDRFKLINYVEKFVGTVRFGNDQFASIVGYGNYKTGNTIISRVYYVEGLSHNLFSVGQFCDGGLKVAFRQHTCHIRNMDKVDLLQGSRTTNLYSISLNDMMSASPICLLTKASSTKS
nr:integrase, catalytic region, zinc finger, CCHC-type, peptidase aspartic, catalytic [Tanacetum cinerariifolium]